MTIFSGSGAWIRTMIMGFKDAPDGCETSPYSLISEGSTPRSATSNSAPTRLVIRRRCVPLAATAATLPDFEEDDDA